MAYNATVTIFAREEGLTLAAQLVDENGEDVGGEITTGFTELVNCYYTWSYASFDEDFIGQVKIYPQADPTDCWFYNLDILVAHKVYDAPTNEEMEAAFSDVAVSVEDKTGFKLASDGIDAILLELGVNARQGLCIIGAALAGVISGCKDNLPKFKGLNSDTTRISAKTDSNGNRLTITLTLPE